MITAKDILQALLEETSEDLEIKKRYQKELLVSYNPSSVSATLKDLKEITRLPEFRGEPILKFIYDIRNNILRVWSAYQEHHANICRDANDELWGALDLNSRHYSIRRVYNERDLGPLTLDKRLAQEAGYPTDLPGWDKGAKRLAQYLKGYSPATRSLLNWW